MWRELFPAGVVAGAALFLVGGVALGQETHPQSAGEINCRVLEVHASSSPPVIAVVFHQRDKQDQAGLASLLLSRSGEKVEAQFGEGEWVEGSVARLKSCFGRGLLFLPSGAPPVKERETFVLRFPSAAAK